MAELSDVAGPIDWGNIAAQIFSGLASNENFSLDGVRATVVAGATQAHAAKLSAAFKFLEWIATNLGKGLEDAEGVALPIMAAFIAPIVGGMFNTEVDAGAFADRANGGARTAAASAIVEAFLGALAGDASGPIDPTDAGAKRIAAAGLQAALEGWFTAAVPELMADLLPIDIGRLEPLAKLPEEVIGALGIGRLVRRALTPLVNATATEPLKRSTNITYRPTQLPVATGIREYFRGRMDETTVYNLLAQHGYRDEHIQALIDEQRKFLPVDDLAWLVWQGTLPLSDAVNTLLNDGYDGTTASEHINVRTLKRVDAINRELASSAITAYVDGRIAEADLDGTLQATIASDQERTLLTHVAAGKKALRAKPLTPAEAKACVEGDILAVQDYRDALDAAGYNAFAADALELLLRKQLDEKKTTAQHKADMADQKATAAALRAKAAADARARADAARALRQRGALGMLENAVIRGLIPIARLEDVLSAEFDPDTVGVYVADVEDKRAAYLATQTKATNAAKRAANAGLSIGQLQTALNDGVLTIDQITPQLQARGLSAADVDVLAETMQETAAAKQAAAKLRAAAQQHTAGKTLTLAQAEALTKAGHWTFAQLADFLAGHGYDAADVASITALVTDAINKAGAAHAIITQTTAANPGKGLTLAQFKNAVVLGQKTIDDYGQFLTAEGFSADATATLVAEAADALATAQAAQQRRTAAAGSADGSAVPLADIRRAAQLGLLSPAQYVADLESRGYSPEDATLELDLLTTEIAAAKNPKPAAGTAEATIAAGTGSATQTAALKHTQVDGELAAKGLSLSETEKAVKGGLLTLDSYQAWLEANGYGSADATLLRALLAASLPSAAAGTAAP